MSKRAAKLRDIREQKRLLVAKANLQRSLFLMAADPVFTVIRAAEMGIFAVGTGRRVAMRLRGRTR
jgi:hypothetical protein